VIPLLKRLWLRLLVGLVIWMALVAVMWMLGTLSPMGA
jgi:hypothetical protein